MNESMPQHAENIAESCEGPLSFYGSEDRTLTAFQGTWFRAEQARHKKPRAQR